MSSVVFTVRRRDLAWATALILLVTTVWVVRGDPADAGAQAPGEGIAVVYIAVGTNFPDSLGTGPGGGVNGAPIIIVPTDPPIPGITAAELVRLDPRKVIIVGGTAVISASMQTALASLLPNAAIERIAGANRYETNALFSQAVFPVEGWVSVPASAFTAPSPATETVALDIGGAWNESSGVLLAPIQLPHGAEILELKAEVYDDNAGADVGVQLVIQHDPFVVTEVGTSGTDGVHTVSSTSITPGLEIVDNENRAYSILVTGAQFGNTIIRWVTVRYRLGAPGA